jgi:hypothetical protein
LLKVDPTALKAGSRKNGLTTANVVEFELPVCAGYGAPVGALYADTRNRTFLRVDYNTLDSAGLRGLCPRRHGKEKEQDKLSGHETFSLGTQHSSSQKPVS